MKSAVVILVLVAVASAVKTAGLNQQYLQSPEQIFQFHYQHQQAQGVQQQVSQGVQQQVPQGVQQQGQGVSNFNIQYSYVQLQKVLQYAQSALKYFVNGQVSNQYASQQLQQVVQNIQQIQPVAGVYPQSYIQSHVAVVYQILNNLNQFVMQQGEQLPQSFVQQVESAYIASQKAYQSFNQQQSPIASALYYQQVLQQINNVQQHLQAQTASPQLNYISSQLSQAYQIYSKANVLSQKAHYIQPLNFIVASQLQKAYQYLNNAYSLAQQQGLAVAEQLQHVVAVAQMLQLNGSYQYQSQVGVPQVQQYAQELVQYVQQQVAHGEMSQGQASYIVQQLQQIQYGISQAQAQQYLKQIQQYIQQQVDVSPVVVQYISQQIQMALQSLNGPFQGPNYAQNYFNGPQAQWYTPYQYNSVQQGQLNTPYQYSSVQQGQFNTPYQYSSVQQGQLNTPYQYNSVYQGQWNTPYQSQFGVNQGQQEQFYTPYQSYQNQGSFPLAYQSQYMPLQLTAVAY